MFEGVLGEELLVREGDPVTLTCTSGTIVINNATTSEATFQSASVQRSDAGFYHCLSSASAMVGSIDSLYLLVACKCFRTWDPVRVS